MSASIIRPSSSTPSKCDESSFIIDDIECSPVIKAETVSPCNNKSSDQMDPLPSPRHLQDITNKPLVLKAPSYSFYSDPEIQAAIREGKMDKKTRERLIRGTINNMISASSIPPFNRFPTPTEVEEMSKSLVITYTCLKDEETGHVSNI